MGVEAAVGGIVIFGFAGGTHGELRHGGGGAIVGKVLNDGEAGAAVGAVEEGVEVAAIVGIEEFTEAVFAGGDVGWDWGGGGCGVFAFEDAEGRVADERNFGGGQVVDDGQGWFARDELALEGIELFAFGFNGDPGAVIEDSSGETVGGREVVDEGTEADSLDYTFDFDTATGFQGITQEKSAASSVLPVPLYLAT